ncbi:hypothetical protein G7K_1972-t1 [Saitoella complicata NRRL Y-17804]|uniref:ERCC4 domain-containing protein n=1 Tax=Saitoella complicata (strain BCRC 22490 / CBS 7301 / JCM 7358 / NBRC 10748 / NRRL Y-17804) TaxID=698492 RepID=A0A0E9ND59_SAICN|nr:hypothetical protein G7K_1972-t1 [Saitoella complicata NRRL Y-17804]
MSNDARGPLFLPVNDDDEEELQQALAQGPVILPPAEQPTATTEELPINEDPSTNDREAQLPEDPEPATIHLSLPLEYQRTAFKEVREEDGLVILARGLGLQRTIANLLHSYDTPGNLVVLVNADSREEDFIGEAIAELGAKSDNGGLGLRIVRNEGMGVEKRQKLYVGGGLFSVSSRILVVDLLTGLLDPEKVTGLVVIRSERVVTTSIEAFILRIFRQKNKDGFIKAFSDNPEPFTTGFAPLTNMMRNLFLRRAYLYPRFHIAVAESLETKTKKSSSQHRATDVVELEVQMTEDMRLIQNAVLECMEVCLAELKRSNPGLIDIEEWNVESALTRNFDVTVRRQLDPVWHRVSWKTRGIVGDLGTLRSILHYLLSYDCVSFNKILETILATNTPAPGSTRQSASPWLFLDAANTIFTLARKRVYTETLGSLKTEPVLEEQPKWGTLAEVMDEIERELHFSPPGPDAGTNSVLIMCSDERTAGQIREYLQTMHDGVKGDGPSARLMLKRKLRDYFEWKKGWKNLSEQIAKEKEDANGGRPGSSTGDKRGKDDRSSFRGRQPPNKRRRVRGGGTSAATAGGRQVITIDDEDQNMAEMAASIQDAADGEVKEEIFIIDQFEDMGSNFEMYDMDDLVCVVPYDGDMDDRVLEELKPRFVIMYDPDPAFIRRIEMYRSTYRNRSMRMYFMYYGASVEEQRYLSSVRKEKDAFTKLIRERGNMALTFTKDTGIEDPQEAFLRTVNTRIAGGGRLKVTAEPPRVVVDVREFRSSLPSLLHGRNLTIIPCLLTVGDYILSPTMCVERKSVKDLIQSLANGRLWTQCETMLLHYKTPIILIEFEQNKSFNLEPFADMTGSIGQNDLQSKLVLLMLAFPKVKIIWSSSPYQTAEIFEDLKKQHEEPDPLKAVTIGLEEGEDATSQYNQAAVDLLRGVPGITERNYKNVIFSSENVKEFVNSTQREIIDMIGPEAGRQVHAFFNRDFKG